MSLQGPILIVADEPTGGMAQAFLDAGAFPVVEASWAGAGILPPGRFEFAATPIDKLRAIPALALTSAERAFYYGGASLPTNRSGNRGGVDRYRGGS